MIKFIKKLIGLDFKIKPCESYNPTDTEKEVLSQLHKTLRKDLFFNKWHRKLLYNSQMKVWENWEK